MSGWANNMEFRYLPDEESLKNYLNADIANSPADRILVVGGQDLFKSLKANTLGGLILHVNPGILEWLCRTCQEIRDSDSRAILVTNFPRESSPPKIRFVVSRVGIAKADGRIGGVVRECSAPAGTSLSLCKPNDERTKLSIYFIGVYAVSYYESVLKAQGSPPKTLVCCKVLSWNEDIGVAIDDRAKLARSKSPSQRRAILVEASENIETMCQAVEEYRETPQYSGGILVPLKLINGYKW